MPDTFSQGFSAGLGLGSYLNQKSSIAGNQKLGQEAIDLQKSGQAFNQDFQTSEAARAQGNYLLNLTPEQIDLMNARAANNSGQSFSGMQVPSGQGQPSVPSRLMDAAAIYASNQAQRQQQPSDGQLPAWNSNPHVMPVGMPQVQTVAPQATSPPPSNAKVTIGQNGLRYSGTVADAIQDAQHPVIGPYIQNSLGKTLASASDSSDAGAVPAQMAPQASQAAVNPALAYNQNLPTGGMPQSPLAIQNMVRQQRMAEAAAQLNWMKEQADVQYKQAEARGKLAEIANTRGTTIAKLAKDAADNPDVAEYYNALMQTAGDDTGLPKSIPAIKSKLNQPTLQIPRDQADAAGIPAEIPNPYQGLPRDEANKQRVEEFKKFQEDNAKTSKSLADAASNIQGLDRFQNLNSQNSTGSYYSLRGVFGADPAYREMSALSDKLALTNKPESLQRLTNFDIALLKNTVPSISYPKEVNDNIVTGMKAAFQTQIAAGQFQQAYFNQHHTLTGADQAWQEYLGRNPIFDSIATKKDYTINQDRIPYQDYFKFKNAGIDNPNKYLQDFKQNARDTYGPQLQAENLGKQFSPGAVVKQNGQSYQFNGRQFVPLQ